MLTGKEKIIELKLIILSFILLTTKVSEKAYISHNIARQKIFPLLLL